MHTNRQTLLWLKLAFLFWQNLANNQLGSVGAYHLSKMLLVNTGLRKLDLSGNGIGDADGGFVAEAIEVGTRTRGAHAHAKPHTHTLATPNRF